MGNQMFQYATGKSLALQHGLELKVDTSILEDHSPGMHAVNRNYDLDLFALEVERATPIERFLYNAHGLSFPMKLARKALAGLSQSRINREQTVGYDPSLAKVSPPPAYLSGLWQSYRYFENIGSELRNDFKLKAPLLETSRSLGDRLASPRSVCLNVRRTDYVNVNSTSEVLGFIGLEYYRSAVERMRDEAGGDLSFFVFSDDLEWCRRELTWLPGDPVFVEHAHAGKKFGNYLALMTRANHFIIPNSTFAWWAAWLATGSQKRVIVPERWFRDETQDSSGLCLKDWIRI